MQIETIERVIGANNTKVNTLNHITSNDCSLNSLLLDVLVPHSFSLLHRSTLDFTNLDDNNQTKISNESLASINPTKRTQFYAMSFYEQFVLHMSTSRVCALQFCKWQKENSVQSLWRNQCNKNRNDDNAEIKLSLIWNENLKWKHKDTRERERELHMVHAHQIILEFWTCISLILIWLQCSCVCMCL